MPMLLDLLHSPLSFTCSTSVPGLLGAWCEELAVDVPPEVLLQEDALLLLEVLQLPESFKEWKVGPRNDGAHSTLWHATAHDRSPGSCYHHACMP
jgi:hypothetical protein